MLTDRAARRLAGPARRRVGRRRVDVGRIPAEEPRLGRCREVVERDAAVGELRRLGGRAAGVDPVRRAVVDRDRPEQPRRRAKEVDVDGGRALRDLDRGDDSRPGRGGEVDDLRRDLMAPDGLVALDMVAAVRHEARADERDRVADGHVAVQPAAAEVASSDERDVAGDRRRGGVRRVAGSDEQRQGRREADAERGKKGEP